MILTMILMGCFTSGEGEITNNTGTGETGTEQNLTLNPENFGNGLGGAETHEEFGTVPPQLEAFEVNHLDSYDTVTLEGALTVTGAERSWELQVEDRIFSVHSPGMFDLNVLNGAAVDLELTWSEWDGTDRSILISDEQGPLYVGGGYAAALLEEAFGTAIVTYGEVVAERRVSLAKGAFTQAYTMVDVTTDNGVVSVLPGEVTPVMIDGQAWELVVHAAYQIHSEDSEIDCPLRLPLLSLELLRMDEGTTIEELIERPDGVSAASYGCG